MLSQVFAVAALVAGVVATESEHAPSAYATTTPAAYTTTPAAYHTTPAAYTTTPAAYTTTPAAYHTTPSVYHTTPAAYSPPANVTVTKTTVSTNYLEVPCTGGETVTQGTTTVTVTKPTTLTFSNCDCHYTTMVPVTSTTPVAETHPATTPSAYTTPAVETHPTIPAPYPTANHTLYTTTTPAGTGVAPSATTPAPFTGAAIKIGSGFAAIAAMAVLAL